MSSSEMKVCPYCGEEIRAVAIRCKHCQMMLDGSGQAAGGTAPGGGAGNTGQGATDDYGSGASFGAGARRLKPGAVLGSGRYELKELLGKGGMGEVFLAEHRYTGQRVALKAVWQNLMDSEGPRKRFLQEGRVLAQLQHPNIVGLTDFFEEDGRFFLVMEYVEGETLSAYLKATMDGGSRVAIVEAKRILDGVLSGLSHAHAQRPYVVHRDIKPSNVMLAKDGRVVLMDFGIAKVAEGEKITRTAGVVGTYEYMSPEQVSGHGISPATDVYAVGILAYELLTGDVPFPQRDESGFDAMEGHKNWRPSPAQAARGDCPAALSGWVDRALAKSPEARYRDAAAMLAALRRGGEPLPAGVSGGTREWMGGTQPGAVPVLPPNRAVAVSSRGRRRGWAVGSLLAVGVVAALVYLFSDPADEGTRSSAHNVGNVGTTPVAAQPSSIADEGAAARSRELEAQAKAAEESKRAADALKAAEAAKEKEAKATQERDAAEAAAREAQERAALDRQRADDLARKAAEAQEATERLRRKESELRQAEAAAAARRIQEEAERRKRAKPCTQEALNCPSGHYTASSSEEAQKAIRSIRKNGDYTESLCLAKWALGRGFRRDALAEGRIHYENSLSWESLGCPDAACESVAESLTVRPKSGGGFDVTCRHCRRLRCSSCPFCP